MNLLKKYKQIIATFVITLLMLICIGAIVVFADDVPHTIHAEETIEANANYIFTPINDTDCDVRIDNKAEVVVAYIPSEAVINGKKYAVKEIAINGFSSSPKLKIVSIPRSVEKIGATAFNNCTALSSVSLGRVKEIGTNAFSRCKQLDHIIIPRSVKKVGNTIFRTNNTKVYVRAEAPAEEWSANWNGSNSQTEVEFGSQIVEDISVAPIYKTTNVRGVNMLSDEILGYELLERQPFNDDFYYVSGTNIIVPEVLNGKPILNIRQNAFEDVSCSKIIVEYSDEPINIMSYAFSYSDCTDIIINRSITFDDDEFEDGSYNVFEGSSVNLIMLPDTINLIPTGAFCNDDKLADIRFITPTEMTLDEEIDLSEIVPTGVVKLPNNEGLQIKSGSFEYVGIKELHIPNNVLLVENNIATNSELEKIYIDCVCGDKDWDEANQTGLKDDWNKGCDAQVLYSKYKVSLDPCGGTLEGDNYIYVIRDEKIGQIKSIPEKENASFGGWFTKPDGQGREFTTESIYDIYENITFYAKWLYVILFDSNGGNNISSEYHGNGESFELPTPINNGRKGCWKDVKSGEKYDFGGTYTMPSKAVKLVALWVYTLSFDSNGGSSISSIEVRTESSIVLPTSSRGGYSGCWKSSDVNKTYAFGGTYVMPNNDVTLIAAWREKIFFELKNESGEYEIYTMNQFNYIKQYATNGYTFALKNDFVLPGTWEGIPEFYGTLDGNWHLITYSNKNVPYGENYGFIKVNNGTVCYIKFKPTISVQGKSSSNDETIYASVGGAVGINNGSLYKVYVEKTITNPYMNTSGSCSVDLYAESVFSLSLGGIAGSNYSEMEFCNNYASLGGCANIGGIVGINYESAKLNACSNNGNIYYNHADYSSVSIAGVAGVARDKGCLNGCINRGTITWAAKLHSASNSKPSLARMVARACKTVTDEFNTADGAVVVPAEVRIHLTTSQLEYVKDEKYAVLFDPPGSSSSGGSCIAEGSLITLADGRQKAVESLTGDEMLLVWNFNTGSFDSAPIIFVDSDPAAMYEVINLYFSDGTTVKVISEHGFWDFTLNKYIYLDDGADKYIGHWFNKQAYDDSGNMIYVRVQLTNVMIKEEYTTAWSPITYEHYSYYVNGMLSMPGGIDGLFNIFEVNSDTMRYDEARMNEDIQNYGLFTYEELSEYLPISEQVFAAFNGQYLKVAIGKGIIDMNKLNILVDKYSKFLLI